MTDVIFDASDDQGVADTSKQTYQDLKELTVVHGKVLDEVMME